MNTLDDWSVITLEDWALIRRLAAEGIPKAHIARRLGVSRTTVVKAAASVEPPKYERQQAVTSFTPFEPRVRAMLDEFPDMPAVVLAERVGWTGSESWFRENVRRIRPEYRRVDPADRLVWEAGDVIQCDLWDPPVPIPLEDGSTPRLHVLVMTAAYSRFTVARILPTKTTTDLLLGMWELLQEFGAVPRRLLWDNEGGIGRGKKPAQGVSEFMGMLATQLVLLPPRDPESKGSVERRNGWFEKSFLPGRVFTSPTDFQHQLTNWLVLANQKTVRTIKARPVERVGKDRANMLPLPPIALHVGWRTHVRLGRDYYVRLDSNDYSVDPTAIGRMVTVTADLNTVKVRLGGRIIAQHDRRWVRGNTITDPKHVGIAKILRQAFQHPRQTSKETSMSDDLRRDLSDYDRAFGLDGEVG